MFVAAVTVKHTDLTTKDHNPQEGIPVSCSVALAGGGGMACSKTRRAAGSTAGPWRYQPGVSAGAPNCKERPVLTRGSAHATGTSAP